MDKYTISRNIESRLEELGMKQIELARRTGITQQSISDYMTGKVQPSLMTLIRIANALDVTLDWLVRG